MSRRFTAGELRDMHPDCTLAEAARRVRESCRIGRATAAQLRAAEPPRAPKVVKAKGPDTASRTSLYKKRKLYTPAISNIFDLGVL